MSRDELREFIISELKTKLPTETAPEEIADFILNQPSMATEVGIRGFLEGYLGK